MAYIETSSLDGESNLKIRQAHQSTASLTDDASVAQFAQSGARVLCDPPQAAIYMFTGVLHFASFLDRPSVPLGILHRPMSHTSHECHIADCSQLLPRGVKLKNTDWVYGVIVYTGRQTKQMLNSRRTALKRCSIIEQISIKA